MVTETASEVPRLPGECESRGRLQNTVLVVVELALQEVGATTRSREAAIEVESLSGQLSSLKVENDALERSMDLSSKSRESWRWIRLE